MSYAVAFSLMEALRTMLRCSLGYRAMRDIIDFNDHAKSACKLTGLLPLHVAVANSLTSMFNFLCDLPGLPVEFDDMRARPTVLSQYGSRTALALMTPLQVAVNLGDQKLVQYILRTQSKQEWEWGPVSSYNLDLKGIDSVGDTPNDVMEICARLDARERTQEMLTVCHCRASNTQRPCAGGCSCVDQRACASRSCRRRSLWTACCTTSSSKSSTSAGCAGCTT